MVMRISRLLAISSAWLMGLAAAITAVPERQDTLDSRVVMDSQGALSKASSALIRRQQQDKAEAFTERAASQTASTFSSTDMYVLVGDNLCNGGGLWKRYELNSVRPGRYEFCAAACNDKDECVGFDVGTTGCNMYTQKAVALGTWSAVRMNNGGPFDGEGDHDAFPKTPQELTLGTNPIEDGEMFKCYRKTYYKPVDSYYWLIGGGTCSGGGLWKRYTMSPGNYSSCSNACNQRDECVGFDVGTWAVSDTTTQIHESNFSTTLRTTTGCFMYTQKPVYGTWPLVQAVTPNSGEGTHDTYPETPNMLSLGHVPRYEVNNATECFGKTHWVSLEQYYTTLGQSLCNGGGGWKHYRAQADLKECKHKCDIQDVCVGIDHEEMLGGGACRLFTRVAVPLGTWEGVQFDTDGPFDGEGAHDKFPPTPFSLAPDMAETPTYAKACMAKTHFESPDEMLFESDR